jgi:hypothetical protein
MELPMDSDPSGKGDDSGDTPNLASQVPAPRADHSSPSSPHNSDDAAWDEFFERSKERIKRFEGIQDERLKAVADRQATLFRLQVFTVILAVITGTLASVSISLYIILDHGHGIASIASGGGFFITGGAAVVLGFMRKQVREEEQSVMQDGEDLRNIEAAMFAARVAPDPTAKCELLGDLQAALNGLIAKQSGAARNSIRHRHDP